MKRIAVIGLGHMGKIYISTLVKLGFSQGEIVGVDIRKDRIAEALNLWPKIKMSESVLDADFWNVEAAILATNTPSHHKVILDLLKKRITNVFCEKPLGIDLQEPNYKVILLK
jgi:predicted dehydrogenase